jgi:uncharacterized protein with LGFP repeats
LCFLKEFQQASVWAAYFDKKAFEVHGDIRLCYNAIGAGPGQHGCPLLMRIGARNHVGRFSNFQNGVIYWIPVMKTFEIERIILTKW